MYRVVEALVDGEYAKLCFVSKESANAFRKFVKIYMDDSGAGNGYEAYWIYWETKTKIKPYIPRNAVVKLNRQLIDSMIYSILEARTAKNRPDITVSYTTLTEKGAICFNIDEFPPRLRPTTGDMFRVPRSFVDFCRSKYTEGRVVQDNGLTLEVIDCFDFNKKDPKIDIIETQYAMKINDWKAFQSEQAKQLKESKK